MNVPDKLKKKEKKTHLDPKWFSNYLNLKLKCHFSLFITQLTLCLVLKWNICEEKLKLGNICWNIKMRCFRRLLGISCRDHVTNEEVRNTFRHAIYWAVWRPYQHCEKTQIETVWIHDKINRSYKDDPAAHGTRREEKRQTEKEMGR